MIDDTLKHYVRVRNDERQDVKHTIADQDAVAIIAAAHSREARLERALRKAVEQRDSLFEPWPHLTDLMRDAGNAELTSILRCDDDA